MRSIPKTYWLVLTAVLAGLLGSASRAAGEILFENPQFRAVLGDDAVWKSLVDKPSGQDYCAAAQRISFALATVGGKTFSARHASLAGDRLTVELGGCDTRLVYRVTTDDDWIVFRLLQVTGARPERLTLVRLGVTITEHVGPRLDGAWNDRYAISLMGINRQTDARGTRRGGEKTGTGSERVTRTSVKRGPSEVPVPVFSGWAELATFTQDAPGPKLEGAGAAIIAVPMSEFRDVLRRAAVAFDLPRNEAESVASKDLPLARQSYWFLSFAERDVDQVIELCRQSGLRQVMLSSGAWCDSPGHYTFRLQNYPDGVESLRRTVTRLHEHGIMVGMHSFASKVSKRDAYVTPVPDRRFLVDMSATLAGDVGPADTTIRTAGDLSQWPGSPVSKRKIWEGGVKKHQEAILDDEIVRYESIGPEGRWDTFLGCQRAAWGTRAAAHRANTACRHYAVDGCIDGYIIDQETTLLDETTTRLAAVFNTCGFDMVYFDGSEDVDARRRSYYTPNFHALAMSKFQKRPLVHMGGGFDHNVWHSFTRTGTCDTYLNTLHGYIVAGGKLGRWPTVKDHIDRSVARAQAAADDLIPAELGWFGIWPKGPDTDGLELDEIEYLMARSLAYNAPISLETSFRQMDSHPLTPGILEIVGAYERLRLAGGVPEASLARLRQQGKDFVLYRAEAKALEASPLPQTGEVQHRSSPRPLAGEGLGVRAVGTVPDFIEVKPLPEVAGTHDIRGFVGPLGQDSIATVWHYLGKEGHLVLDTPAIAANDIQGNRIPTEPRGGKTAVPLGNRRTTLRLVGIGPEQAAQLLARASFEPRKPVVLWIKAENFAASAGQMARASAVGIAEKEAIGDVVLGTGPADRTGKTSYCEYRVMIPHKGRWTLWARIRYPTATDMSFGLRVMSDRSSPPADLVLGNCGANKAQWHWTGQGGGLTTAPPGRPITLSLDAGPVVFRLWPREAPGRAATNPRIDCLCLTDDPAYVPTDAESRAALK